MDFYLIKKQPLRSWTISSRQQTILVRGEHPVQPRRNGREASSDRVEASWFAWVMHNTVAETHLEPDPQVGAILLHTNLVHDTTKSFSRVQNRNNI